MFVPLTPQHVVENLQAYLAAHADVSPWGPEHLLADLPNKWDLSFAVWEEGPIGYCVLSRKFGAVHIHQFMVAQEHRGKGIGAKMLSEAVRRGAETLKVARENEGATRFYERYGWVKQREEGGYLWLRRDLVNNHRARERTPEDAA